MSFFGGGQHTVTRADKISNFNVATAEYGAPVMEILGTTRVSGNVIYYDDFTAHEHKETVRTGKGGGSTSTQITYTYTVAVILGLCEGPISGIGKVWRDKKTYIYPDERIELTLFRGTDSQQPWSYVTGKHPTKALPYTNLAYMAGVVDLGDSSALPNFNFEVKGRLLSTGDGTDVNPMDYIKYVLNKVGQNVTVNGEDNFRSFCANAGLLISTPADASGTEEAQKIVNEIAELCGAYIFWSNNAYKVVPLAERPVGSWTPDRTIRYDLTPDDFIPQNGSCIIWSRKDTSEQYNRWTVEYLNRAHAYEKESVTYEDTEDIAERGVKQAPTINARYIYTKGRAVKIATAAARRSKVGKNQYKFKLGWAFCRLEPGDLVRITDEASGIDNQPVMITDIQESADGFLNVTAISWFRANYGPAEYDVHEVDRPYVDFNAEPGDTAPPVIFQPPSDLTQNGLELWIAAKGLTSNWGGCTVYVSDDNENYRLAGQITNSARIGTLASNLTASGTSLEVTINGTMLSGSDQDAERANTLLWIDGECLSYKTATLLQNGNYQLTGLIRGQYNTTATAHSSGSTLVRCDEALLHEPFLKEDVGKTIYLKFCSYNIFGAAEQTLAEVQAYEYTILPYYIPPVTNLTAYNRYRQIHDGVARYDIVVQWQPPNLKSYLEGQVWYKSNHAQADLLVVEEGVAADQLGYQSEWIFAGSGKDQAVIPQAVVGDTYRIAVCTKDQWGAFTGPDTSPQTTIVVALRSNIPNTPDDFAITFGENCTASWKEVTNADIAYYEIRNDQHPGVESVNLLARTNGTSVAVPLTVRRGTLYLYARSAVGKYSAPAVLEYFKPAPRQPDPPMLKAKIGGFNITTDAVPAGCNGMHIYIDAAGTGGNEMLSTTNATMTYMCDPGIYDVQVAYTDIFGEGPKSGEARVTVLAYIDPELIKAESISLSKMDSHIKGVLEEAQQATEDIAELKIENNKIKSQVTDTEAGLTSMIKQTADSIDSVVTSLRSDTYSAISQMQDAIELRVAADEVVSKINMSPETITIDGKYIHCTGDTVFDNNIVTRGMIQANAVTSDKISVNSLSAICATIGTLRTATSGARLEVTSSVIRVYDANNVLRVRLGVW